MKNLAGPSSPHIRTGAMFQQNAASGLVFLTEVSCSLGNCDVACVRQRENSIERDSDTAGCRKAELPLRNEDTVEAAENIRRIMRVLTSDCTEDHGNAHRCCQSFAGDIAENGRKRPIVSTDSVTVTH